MVLSIAEAGSSFCFNLVCSSKTEYSLRASNRMAEVLAIFSTSSVSIIWSLSHFLCCIFILQLKHCHPAARPRDLLKQHIFSYRQLRQNRKKCAPNYISESANSCSSELIFVEDAGLLKLLNNFALNAASTSAAISGCSFKNVLALSLP